MRRSRLLVAMLLNLLALAIIGWSFTTRSSMANIFGLVAIASFAGSFLIFRGERRRIEAKKPTLDQP